MENPPTYTDEWGFADGAQNDIFTAAVTPAGTTGIANPYATPTGTQTFEYVYSITPPLDLAC